MAGEDKNRKNLWSWVYAYTQCDKDPADNKKKRKIEARRLIAVSLEVSGFSVRVPLLSK